VAQALALALAQAHRKLQARQNPHIQSAVKSQLSPACHVADAKPNAMANDQPAHNASPEKDNVTTT
jgi:hypothetical protein